MCVFSINFELYKLYKKNIINQKGYFKCLSITKLIIS